MSIDPNQPLISQDELAALSSVMADASGGNTNPYNVDLSLVKHDLTSEDSSLGVNVASLDMINERFIRLFRLGMLELLRTMRPWKLSSASKTVPSICVQLKVSAW